MMPLNPSPYAAETANRPASLWVTVNAAIASAWQAEPANTAASPPIRSVNQPQNIRLTEGAEQHRQHRRPLRPRDAEVAAERHEMPRGHRHRHAAQERRRAEQRLNQIWLQLKRLSSSTYLGE